MLQHQAPSPPTPWHSLPAPGPAELRGRIPRQAELPFDPGVKMMAIGAVASLVLWVEELRELIVRRRSRRGRT